MLTAKALLKEMEEAGFLTEKEIIEVLQIELPMEEINKILTKLKKDKKYIDFLEGNYKRCSICKNLFILDCFHKHKNGKKNECKTCSNKIYKERYKDKTKQYRKTTYQNKKDKGLIDNKQNSKHVRASRMKKLLYSNFKKKYPQKVINELVEIKYNLLDTVIKDNIIIVLCFLDNGEYVGKKYIEKILEHSNI